MRAIEIAIKKGSQRALRRIALGLCLIGISLLSSPAAFAFDGAQVVTGGGTVNFTGVSSTNWVTYVEDGVTKTDFLLVYSNAAEKAASFTLPGTTSMRLFAVGGGGGGGGSYSRAANGQPYGGGGGGGAGQVIELEGTFEGTNYLVSVGAGGAGGEIRTSHSEPIDYSGKNGLPTSVTTNGVPLFTAVGGGAGGGETNGWTGASGGGGSMRWVTRSSGTEMKGGEATAGYAGGKGDAYNYGGGGGGAGGPGANASATTFGTGGAGVKNNITGEDRWYAAGGGGGYNNSRAAAPETGIAGGSGVGGTGGVGNKLCSPTAGAVGTGSGGGGGSYNEDGGAGGCGCVIVRIVASLDGPLDKPVDTRVPYDGQPHSVVPVAPFYTIEGVNGGTEVGTYTVKVTPIENVSWTDGTRDTVTVTMVLYSGDLISGTVDVTGAPIRFWGATETNWVKNAKGDLDLLLVFKQSASFELPGSSSARILAVGGGGGGGGGYSRAAGDQPYGGGGGGGAGEVVDTTQILGGGSYAVNVGAGGAGGTIRTSHSEPIDYSGKNGQPSFITTNGVAVLSALGGGAGGGETNGWSGASGGGGSMRWVTRSSGAEMKGGEATAGYAGGKGDAYNYGGGGGGAGGPGANASTPETFGTGGAGVQNDITVAAGTAKEAWPWYAAGGGGGYNNSRATGPTTGIAGGSGIGGTGGVGSKLFTPTAGAAGTGSGGGGASYNEPGGAGGSGVVVVRISSAMQGDFKKPASTVEYVYDGTEHVSITPNIFYDVGGEKNNIGTTAGVYRATAVLRGGVWPEGGDEPVEVTMTIHRLPVTIDSLTQDGWIFRDEEKGETPDPSLTWVTDPNELHDLAKFVVDYKKRDEGSGMGDESGWSETKPTLAGEYLVRVRSVETNNFDCAEKTNTFAIAQLSVKFLNLLMRDWMEGMPEDETPNPSVETASATGVPVVPVFEYGKKGVCKEDNLPGTMGDNLDDYEWTTNKPAAAGSYVVRVRAPDFDNYTFTMAYADFAILKGLANLYTDWVKITISKGRQTAENYPFAITVNEKEPTAVGAYPYGFLYSRAGVDGEALAFTDVDGNVLPYKVVTWNEDGDSKLTVRLPLLSSDEAVTIYLYWHLRDGKKAPEHFYAPPVAPFTQPRFTFDLVNRDNRRVNYWVRPKVAMDKYVWASGETPGRLTATAKLAEGTVITNIINAFSGEIVGHTLPTTEVSAYRASFVPDDPRGIYEPIECHVDFRITGVIELSTLGGVEGDVTLNGRTLLANDDEASGHAVWNQGWWLTNAVDSTDGCFWDHGTSTHQAPTDYDNTFPYMLYGVNHLMKHVNDDQATNIIWRLKDVLMGNQFRRVSGKGDFHGTRAYLPWATTAHGVSSREAAAQKITSMDEVGNLLLRNRIDAAIYSPCYEDGIGTIYFDVVNSGPEGGAGSYKIVVEVATTTAEGKDPTDANCTNAVGTAEFPYLDGVGSTNWVKQTIFALKRDNNAAAFSVEPTTKELDLLVVKMGTSNNFYRVYVPVNHHGPARFRIRRTSTASEGSVQPTTDMGGFILVDNVIVSYPQMTARMEPCGDYDPAKIGKSVLGWAAAMQTPFPAVGATDVRARAKPVRIASGLTNVNAKTLITEARLHYRWRYLDQRTNDWQVITLPPAGNFVSDDPLVLPDAEGDMEFWLENDTQIPYYTFYDYSGTGLGLGPSGYSEAVGTVTNNYRLASLASLASLDSLATLAPLPNGGTNWFFRLRNGRSDYERIYLDVEPAEGNAFKAQTVAFDLTGNRIWRAFLQTPSNTTGKVKFRVRAENLQDPTAAEYAERYATNTVCWKLTTAGIPVGASGIGTLTETAKDEPVENWSELTLDDKAGYVMVQIDDKALSLTAVHGEKQDFNLWTDANKKDGEGLFLGQARPGEPGSSGTSSDTQKYMASFTNWYPSVSVDPVYWREAFDVDTKQIGPGKTYELGKYFGSADTPNGWKSGPGMWMASSYGDSETGLALQMQGQGAGFLEFTDGAHVPRGLRAIRFTARLAQFIGWHTFAYWDETDVKKSKMSDYTFVTKAAFDTQSLTAFSGAASVSVLAYYLPNVGAYEFRVTQKTAKMDGKTPIGAGRKRTLQLFRWGVDSKGQLAATQLGDDYDVEWTADEDAKWITASDATTANFPQLFISCSNATDGASTVIRAGVSREGQTPSTTAAASSACLTYTDADAKHLTAGTFGVGSASCPARFCALYWNNNPVKGVAAPAANKLTKTAAATPTWPGSLSLCTTSIRSGEWSLPPDRIEIADDGSTSTVGFRAKVFPQQIKVYTAPKDGDWSKEPINTFDVASFGASGANATNEVVLYATGDSRVKIQMAGDSNEPRCDVIIDDVELEQWRGESYDETSLDYGDKDGRKARKDGWPADQLRYGCPTNFVFTSAWLEGDETQTRTVKLSARRTTAGVASSLRTPFMDGQEGRGVGLGFVSFAWENAQSNAVLQVQVSTNVTDKTALVTATKSSDEEYWTTKTNITFSAMTDEERASGSFTYYFGLHGQAGAMRIVVDPKVVEAVKDSMEPTLFGEVDIVSMTCSDEPDIDERSWWGWNLRTTDETNKLWLADWKSARDPSGGMAFGLNNSVSLDTRKEYGEAYNEHLPFLQTPALSESLIGEISFRARRYEPNKTAAPEERTFVTLYGSNSSTMTDANWTWVESWEVTNDVYSTFTYRANQGVRFAVFRLVVTGVENVKTEGYMPKSRPQEVGFKPLRVLIDEVMVSESVEARVAFRNVRAFRYHLEDSAEVVDIMSKNEQPLCKESFGVQGEVYAAQLGDEIDISRAKVRLWWYPRESPWGFANWQSRSETKWAWLAESSDTKGVFRSSYLSCPGAVIEPQNNRTTLQFMLEVIWKSAKDNTEQTNWLERADWVNPEWYAPVDKNDRADGAFSGYTILDTVAPGWAWINELNLYGHYYSGWNNSDKTLQFMEVAAPGDADMSGWQIRFINAKPNEGTVVTNVAARFGDDLPGRKDGLRGIDPTSGYVFHVLASPLTAGVLTTTPGQVDGFWRTQDFPESKAINPSGEFKWYEPVSVQLVRPSGIVEHEITGIGTNYYWTTPERNPVNHTDYLNDHEPGGHWLYVGADDTGGDTNSDYEWSHSLGVHAGQGGIGMAFAEDITNYWNNVHTMTPGNINGDQYISPDWPRPLGSSIVIYAMLGSDHIRHAVGDSAMTNTALTLVFRKGDPDGTNIVYETDPWYEIGAVTNNGRRTYPVAVPGATRTWTLNVAKNVSNDVTVTANAAIDSRLERDYGLDPNDPYREAIVDWLTKGENITHQRWHDPDATELGMAEFVNAADEWVTNLNLKAMYWLDIDPTWPEQTMRLKGYMDAPTPTPDVPAAGYTNVKTSVFMMITNKSNKKAWAPYVLRGTDPAFTSWEYAEKGSYEREWTDVNFKVTGILVNGDEATGDFSRGNWLPLRNFVFDGTVGADGKSPVSKSFDANFKSKIEVRDPYKKNSPGYGAGWYDWVQEHGWCPVWWRWDLDERIRPETVEVLKTENYYK